MNHLEKFERVEELREKCKLKQEEKEQLLKVTPSPCILADLRLDLAKIHSKLGIKYLDIAIYLLT